MPHQGNDPSTAPDDPRKRNLAARTLDSLSYAVAGIVALYGGYLCLTLHFSGELDGPTLAQILGVALLSAAIYAVGIRIWPSFSLWRRKATSAPPPPPTMREIWEALPGDIVDGMLLTIGVIALVPVLWDGNLFDIDNWGHVALALAVTAMSLFADYVWNLWRGRRIFDPPG